MGISELSKVLSDQNLTVLEVEKVLQVLNDELFIVMTIDPQKSKPFTFTRYARRLTYEQKVGIDSKMKEFQDTPIENRFL